MTSPDIIEAAARALHDTLGESSNAPQAYRHLDIVLAAVTPLIRAAALEEAAVVAEDADLPVISLHIATAIRALKEQP